MMLPSFRKLSLLAVISSAPLFAQTTSTPTWFTVAHEDSAIAVTLPAGTTYRWGTPTCAGANNSATWTQYTVTAQTTISPLSNASVNPFPFADPCYGTAKELDVLETSTVQTVSVSNSSSGTPTTVAMVVPSIVPATVVSATPGSNHTLTFTNFTVAPGSSQNALMFAFVNQPANNANNIWEGTQMNLNIDGVVLTCSYGQTYTSGVFTLSCTVPVTTTTQTASN